MLHVSRHLSSPDDVEKRRSRANEESGDAHVESPDEVAQPAVDADVVDHVGSRAEDDYRQHLEKH